jgi:N-acyl amino acid synthase of PEP-CTERM/exosortase system
MTLRHDDLNVLQTRMTVEVAQTPDAVREAQALRHQVFCLERRLFDTRVDQDPFDQYARHLVVRRSSDREVVATSRIVRSRIAEEGIALPMHKYCCPTLFRNLPMESVGEISRFAISKQARGAEASSGPAVRLLLLRGILQTSQAMGLTHWCALMEPSLIRLLSATGVQFDALGSLVECFGQRLPCVARIDRAVSRARMSHPHFYEAVATQRYSRAA